MNVLTFICFSLNVMIHFYLIWAPFMAIKCEPPNHNCCDTLQLSRASIILILVIGLPESLLVASSAVPLMIQKILFPWHPFQALHEHPIWEKITMWWHFIFLERENSRSFLRSCYKNFQKPCSFNAKRINFIFCSRSSRTQPPFFSGVKVLTSRNSTPYGCWLVAHEPD